MVYFDNRTEIYPKKVLTKFSRNNLKLAHLGYKLSEKTKQKISIARKGKSSGMLGKHHTEKSREKMSISRIGKKHKPHSEETKLKIGLGNRGKKLSEEVKTKISNFRKGKKHTEITKLKISLANKGKKRPSGKKHYAWKGGITSVNEKIRKSLEYKLWRKAIFERDNWTCVWCGDNKGGNLNADHIKPFSLFPELRFAIDNGRTLCNKCHRKTNTYGWNIFKIV